MKIKRNVPQSRRGTRTYTSSVDVSSHDPPSAIINSPSHHTDA
jgi:hypothetical protein